MGMYFVDFSRRYLRCFDVFPALICWLFGIKVLEMHIAPDVNFV